MTAMIDAAGSSASARNGDLRQTDDTRQARWLYDLEQALLEQGLKPYLAAEDERHGARVGQDALPRKLQHGAEEQASQAAVGEAFGASQAQTQPQEEALSPQAVRSAGAAQPSAVGTPAVLLARPAGTAAPALAGTSLQGLATEGLQREVQPAQAGVDAMEVPAALRGAAPMLRPSANLLTARDGGQASEGQPTEAKPSAQPPEAAGEPFEKRLLHLFYGRDGVHAFVRDAELQAEQMRSLAQNLASELGGEGRRLASLTVNGRKAGAAPGMAGDAEITAQHDAPKQDSTRSIR